MKYIPKTIYMTFPECKQNISNMMLNRNFFGKLTKEDTFPFAQHCLSESAGMSL